MIKTYKANTNVSVNVVLGSKKNLHVSFMPLSDGTSVYSTDSEDVQTALERHYRFGNLFRLVSTDSSSSVEQPVIQSEDGTDAIKETVNAQEQKKTTIKVSDLATAKDYLADTFGISRTALRSEKAILAQAEAHGVVFEGLSK